MTDQISDRPALALFQPDIAGNTGTLLRLCACLGVHLHIIEPAGFRLDDTALKRAGMDYLDLAAMTRHLDFEHFEGWRTAQRRRLVLMTTKASRSCYDASFLATDVIMLGRESSGVPEKVHKLADERILIPMQKDARSLNVALSGAMVMGEACRQTGSFG